MPQGCSEKWRSSKNGLTVRSVMILPALVVALSLAADPTDSNTEASAPAAEVRAADPYVSSMTDRRVGGVVAPAALPAGAMSVYALLGAPELGGGFRQGFSMLE